MHGWPMPAGLEDENLLLIYLTFVKP
jgi:hypothetical protein